MSDGEVLETSANGRYRVRLVLDDDPTEPEFDAGFPVLRIEKRGDCVNFTGYGDDVLGLADGMRGVLCRRDWRTALEVVERWLGIYHGGRTVEYDTDYGVVYAAYTCVELEEKHGITPGSAPEMDEWRAYIEGDVYGYVVEENVTWTTEADYDDRESWEHVDSCWGLYGGQYAREAAMEQFTYQVEQGQPNG